MADHGAEWYKRDPQAHLGGVVGMTARQHAVYSVILDLIYAYGGRCLNKPKWFAGWFSDLGPAAIRNTISELVALGKLQVEGDFLTNKRARNEAKTREKLREDRRETGKKGGISSGILRADLKESNDLAQANASPREKKRRRREEEEDGGDGSARTREDDPISGDEPEKPDQIELSDLRGQVIEAAGIEIEKSQNPQRWFGSEATHTIERWVELGLASSEIIETVLEVTAAKTDGPPSTLAYFNPAMQRRAGLKLRPDLKPTIGEKPNDGQSARERRAEADLAADIAYAIDLDRTAAGGG